MNDLKNLDWDHKDKINDIANRSYAYSEAAWAYPKEIFRCNVALNDLRAKKDALKSQRDTIENNLYEVMLGDTTLTSDVKRKAGLSKLHKECEPLQQCIQEIAATEAQIRGIESEIDFCKDKRRALESSQSVYLELLRLYQFNGAAGRVS